MKNKLIALLIIKPLIILALVVALKPQTKVEKTPHLSEEIQSMRGYFLEDQSLKIVLTHQRLQFLKDKIINSKQLATEGLKNKFIKMVKDFNKAIGHFEKLEEYKSSTWNDSRKKFITLMKNVEKQQMNLNEDLGNIRTVSI